tara:strand:- start:18 stop:173 length:156 start_codon:yes stop_codon:yes gene_type:complete
MVAKNLVIIIVCAFGWRLFSASMSEMDGGSNEKPEKSETAADMPDPKDGPG